METKNLELLINRLKSFYTMTYGESTGVTKESKVIKVTTADIDGYTVITLDVQVTVPPDQVEIYPLEFQIPNDDNQLVKADGKSKVQITSAKRSAVIQLDSNKIQLRGKNYAYISPVSREDRNNTNMRLNIYGDDRYFKFKEVLKYFNLLPLMYPDEDVNSIGNLVQEDIDFISSFELDQRVIDKVFIISEGTIKLSTKFDAQLVTFICNIFTGKDTREYGIDTPMDYIYISVIEGLADELREKYSEVRLDILSRLNKFNKVYSTKIQNIINRYFRQQATNFRDVQSPKDTNAVSMMSQGKHLYFYDYKDTRGNKVDTLEKQRVRFNSYFYGFLDPVKSADGPNINMANETTMTISIESGTVYITLLDLNFKKVKVKYVDYLKSKVLSIDNVDWITNKIIKNKLGTYDYMQFGKYYQTSDISDIQYIRTVDNMVSPASYCIPFINKEVATRGLMSSHFLDQACPVHGAQPCPVHTPANALYYKDSPYNIKSKVNGEVVGILGNKIKVRGDDGKEVIYDSEPYNATANHTTNIYEPIVKVGQRVKKDDVLIKMNSFVDNEFAVTVPLYTMYGTYEAHEHEDGIIISESAAKKFTHDSIADFGTNLLDKNRFLFIKNETDRERFDDWGLIRVGQKVKAGDLLFTYGEAKNDKIQAISSVLLNGKTAYQKQELKAPLDVGNYGEVISAEIIVNTKSEENPEFNQYYENINREKSDKELVFTGVRPEDEELDEFIAYSIRIHIKYYNTMDSKRLSGKLSNYYASKGVNTYIIPDEDCLYDELGNKIECVISLLSTFSRQNPGQLDEVKLGLISLMGWRFITEGAHYGKFNSLDSVEVYTEDPRTRTPKNPDDPKVKAFLDELYPTGWKWNEILKVGRKYGYLRVTVSPFEKYFDNARIRKLLNMLELGEGNYKVYNPKTGKWTNKLNTVGVTSMMRLHFIQEAKAKATPDASVQFENPSDLLAYSGVTKDDGQKTGAQEIWAHWGHGNQDLVKNLTTYDGTKSEKFISTALMLGLKLEED